VPSGKEGIAFLHPTFSFDHKKAQILTIWAFSSKLDTNIDYSDY
jgi:hypothetical protein